jgi:MFS family permease
VPDPGPSPWSPLRRPTFRALWIATLASQLGTWMHDVSAGWLMTSMRPDPLLVSLVQAATAAPMFLLAFPAGALADIVDRRRILIAAQALMLVTVAALGAITIAGGATPVILLGFTFLLGIGAALNAPAWQALVPDLVPRAELEPAVLLNGITVNVARAVGPAIGGLLVAAAGPGAVFLLNAVSFVGVLFVLLRWKREIAEPHLPAERLVGAMRAGFRYVRRAPAFQAVVIRSGTFILCGSSLWALLPLYAREQLASGPAGYGVLLGSFGVGALGAALALPRVRRALGAPHVLLWTTAAYALALLGLAATRDARIACAVLALAGFSWLGLLSTYNVSAQTALPSWVRGRALALYLVVFFGAMAAGSALWGAVASRAGMPLAFVVAAAGVLAAIPLARRFPVAGASGLDLAPSVHWPAPRIVGAVDHDRGPVMVTVEYRVTPERVAAFARDMDAVRTIRERDGAFFWGLFVDAADPGRHVESFLVDSWIEHLRQHARVTVADRAVLERVRTHHAGPDGPVVAHWLAEEPPPGKDES